MATLLLTAKEIKDLINQTKPPTTVRSYTQGWQDALYELWQKIEKEEKKGQRILSKE